VLIKHSTSTSPSPSVGAGITSSTIRANRNANQRPGEVPAMGEGVQLAAASAG
jgi:hypothetical protein